MPELANNQTVDDVSELPSRNGLRAKHWLILILVFCAILAYPIAVIFSHKVIDEIPDLVPSRVWVDPRTGTAVELLERESYFGWASSKPSWHPQSRLTAMPAFQNGLANGLAQFVSSRAELVENGADDTDLSQAEALLKSMEGSDADDRLYAAIEALKRFDGRKANFLVEEVTTLQTLRKDLKKFSEELDQIEKNLRLTASRPSRGVFNRADVDQFYRAKGAIHAFGMLVKSYPEDTTTKPGFEKALADLNTAFHRASLKSPVTVSNTQPGSFGFGGNDFMALVYLITEIRSKLATVDALIEEEPKDLS